MANTTNSTKIVKKENTESQIDKNNNLEIEALKKANDELKNQLDTLMKMMESFTQKEKDLIVENHEKIDENNSTEFLEEPNPGKMIRIVSLCRGSLNMDEDNTGRGLIHFDKYGETKTVLYSSLVNIVNNNRKFAEKGLFYILDKSAVYYLGLQDVYKKIITNDVIDNILNYDDVDIVKIINNTEPTQIQTMANNLVDKIYYGANLDLNKVQLISNESGIDIMGKVKQMKEFESIKK